MLRARYLLLLGAALLALAACAPDGSLQIIPTATHPPRPAPPPPPPNPALQMKALEMRINELIDIERAKINPKAQPLSVDSELVDIARRRSEDLARRNTLANPGEDTHVSATMLMDQDAQFQGLLGENLAAQYYVKQTGVDVETFAHLFVDGWLASQPNKDLLAYTDYNRTGVGAAVNGDTVYVVQLFATDLGLGPHIDNGPKKVGANPPGPADTMAGDGRQVPLRGSEGANP